MDESILSFSPRTLIPHALFADHGPAQLSSPGQQTRLSGLSPAATRRPQQEEYE
jgi:hypothetical protein